MKWLLAGVALAALLSSAACGSDTSAPTSPTATTLPAPTPAPAPSPAPAPAPEPPAPVAVANLVVSPDYLRGSADARATITLNRAAEAGGVTIVTSSSNPDLARVDPVSVVIPAGATTGTFDVKGFGYTVSQSVVVIIEAKLNGVGKAAGITVAP